jgi:hypothetical protein
MRELEGRDVAVAVLDAPFPFAGSDVHEEVT